MPIIDEPSGSLKEIIGVGFGPANLALAIAAEEFPDSPRAPLLANTVFFDKQPSFGWHRGMLIDGATMQVSFLKDLATMRNPTSRYTFVSYLHAKDRLADFINSKTIFPYRTEFHGYLEWAAERFESVVSYDSKVTAIHIVRENGVARYLDVVVVNGNGGSKIHRTRNVVIGAGLVPRLPDGVVASSRVWHSSELLTRLAGLPDGRRRSFAVIGAGQSAAEVVSHLHRTFPEAQVHAIFSRFGYSIADDSPFTNRIFDPLAVDHFYHAPDGVKEMLLSYHGGTNYSVVDLDLTRQLHDTVYREAIVGNKRLYIHNVSHVRAVEEFHDGVDLTVEFLPRSTIESIRVDALIYATGYRPYDPFRLLAAFESECKRDDQGRVVLSRDYKVVTSDVIQCGIYVHGGSSEHSHGLSSGLLSNVAVRAGEVIQAIVKSQDPS